MGTEPLHASQEILQPVWDNALGAASARVERYCRAGPDVCTELRRFFRRVSQESSRVFTGRAERHGSSGVDSLVVDLG